jgi:hypothetical protein
MKLPSYKMSVGKSNHVFEFTSIGKKGKIEKMIVFEETTTQGFYNLAFGDKDIITGMLNDIKVSNNGDSEKVLATIVRAVYIFLELNPNVWIYAEGSTKSRTRLYRMGITKYIKEAELDFYIFGSINNSWEKFTLNVDYESFAILKKKN